MIDIQLISADATILSGAIELSDLLDFHFFNNRRIRTRTAVFWLQDRKQISAYHDEQMESNSNCLRFVKSNVGWHN